VRRGNGRHGGGDALLVEILSLEFDDRAAGELLEQQMKVVKTP
jgi:hypothetical protein